MVKFAPFMGKMAVLMMFNGVLLGKVTVFNEENDDSPAHKHILGWNKEFMTHEILGYQYPVLTPRYTLKLFYFHCQGNYQRGHHWAPNKARNRSHQGVRDSKGLHESLDDARVSFPGSCWRWGSKYVSQSPFCWHFGSTFSRCNLWRGTAMVKHHGFVCPIKSHHSNGWISWHPIGAKWNAGLSNIMNSCNPLTSVLWTRTYQFQVAMCCSCLLVWCACLVVWYWSSHKLMSEFKSSDHAMTWSRAYSKFYGWELTLW